MSCLGRLVVLSFYTQSKYRRILHKCLSHSLLANLIPPTSSLTRPDQPKRKHLRGTSTFVQVQTDSNASYYRSGIWQYDVVLVTLECNSENEIKSGEPIRCRDCGHRIFYKPRTTKSKLTSRWYISSCFWSIYISYSGTIRNSRLPLRRLLMFLSLYFAGSIRGSMIPV
jgi:DNA-directed RNA polymerase subunit RPC12/RpoP